MRQSDHAILLINTGSPHTTEVSEVRRYLRHFLSDPRIIGAPAPLRWLLVNGIIAPLRAPASARKYRRIYTHEGSPLVFLTERLARKMSDLSGTKVYTCMRYNQNSTRHALRQAIVDGIHHLTLIPLFPHYAISSWESAVEQVRAEHAPFCDTLSLEVVPPYYDAPLYIGAVAHEIATRVNPGTHLLVSLHGLPLSQAYAYRHDPDRDYVSQTDTTVELLTQHPLLRDLRLTIETAYQSRFGHSRWLSPNTRERLSKLPSEGSSEVAVVCPGFVCDCLETLWEIEIDGRAVFEKAGGRTFTFIPCPNDSDAMARCLLRLPQNG